MSIKFLQTLFPLLLVATVSIFSHNTTLGQTNSQSQQVDTTAYMVVQVPPQFPGGSQAMFQFIQSASYYPLNPKKGLLVQLKLLVEKDGSISSVKAIYAEANDEFVKEAMRIIKTMPKWIPGSHDGRLLRAYTIISIRFTNAKK